MNTWSYNLPVDFTNAVEEVSTRLQTLNEFPVNISVSVFAVIDGIGQAFTSPEAIFRACSENVKLKFDNGWTRFIWTLCLNLFSMTVLLALST